MCYFCWFFFNVCVKYIMLFEFNKILWYYMYFIWVVFVYLDWWVGICVGIGWWVSVCVFVLIWIIVVGYFCFLGNLYNLCNRNVCIIYLYGR